MHDLVKKCKSCCGKGRLPVYHKPGSVPAQDSVLLRLWREAHESRHKILHRIKCAWTFKNLDMLSTECNGWHLVQCPDCKGKEIRE